MFRPLATLLSPPHTHTHSQIHTHILSLFGFLGVFFVSLRDDTVHDSGVDRYEQTSTAIPLSKGRSHYSLAASFETHASSLGNRMAKAMLANKTGTKILEATRRDVSRARASDATRMVLAVGYPVNDTVSPSLKGSSVVAAPEKHTTSVSVDRPDPGHIFESIKTMSHELQMRLDPAESRPTPQSVRSVGQQEDREKAMKELQAALQSFDTEMTWTLQG